MSSSRNQSSLESSLFASIQNLLDCEKKSFILKEPVQLDDNRKYFKNFDILLSSPNHGYIEKISWDTSYP